MIKISFFLIFFLTKLTALQNIYIDASGKTFGTNYFTNLQLALKSFQVPIEIVIITDLIVNEKILIEKSVTIRCKQKLVVINL